MGDVSRMVFYCSTFIYVFLVAASTGTAARATSPTFDRRRHLLSMCLILCRHAHSCTNVTAVPSELRCHIEGEENLQKTYFFNCLRNNETLSEYIKSLSTKHGISKPHRSNSKQHKGRKKWTLYRVDVITGSMSGAGTGCDISLILLGDKGMVTKKLRKKGFVFKLGSVGHFEFRELFVGKLKTIKVKIVKKGIVPSWAWQLDAITVTVMDGVHTCKYLASVNIWLGEFSGKTSMETVDLAFKQL